MVWNIFVEPFLLLSYFIGNTFSNDVVSKNYRFQKFSVAILESNSVKTGASNLIRKFTQDQKFNDSIHSQPKKYKDRKELLWPALEF